MELLFSQWLANESFDRVKVNQLIQRIIAERDAAIAAGGTGGKFLTFKPEEIAELSAIAEVAKQKVMAAINGPFKQDWAIYKQWETQFGSNLAKFASFAPLNSGMFKQAGPTEQTRIDNGGIIMRPEFFHAIQWRDWIKDYIALIEPATKGSPFHMVSVSSLIKGLRLLSPLVNQ